MIDKDDLTDYLLKAEDKTVWLFERIELAIKKLDVIEESYREFEDEAVERINRIRDLNDEKEELKEEILISNLSTLNKDLSGIMDIKIREALKKRLKKLDELELDDRIEKILNAEEAIKAQKKSIYIGVATIVAIGVIAVFMM